MLSHSPVTVVDAFSQPFELSDKLGKGSEKKEKDETLRLYEGESRNDEAGVEMVAPGTDVRNEQQDFELHVAQESFDRAINHFTNSEFDAALREFLRSLAIREDLLGRCDELTAKSYLWVGTIHFHKNDFERALDNFSRAFRIQYEDSSDKSTKCKVVMNWINKTLAAKGMKSVQDKGVYWKKQIKCIEHEQRADKFRLEGQYTSAIESYRTALQLEYSRREMNPNSPGRPLADAADLFFKIGKCYQSQKQHARAMMEFRQAYAIYFSWGGSNQRYSLQTWDSMADVAFEMGFRAAVIGDYLDDMQQAIRCEQTGDWMLESQDYDNALKQYKAALEYEEKVVGLVQCCHGMLHFKMGKVYRKMQKQHDALLHFSKAVGVFDRILGSQHRYTSMTVKAIHALAM